MVTALASGALKGLGRRRGALGARTAPSAAAVCPLSRAIWRASDLRPESARCSERPSDALGAPAGEKSAQVAGRAIGEIRNARGLAEAFLEEGEKLPDVAAVSLERARRQAPLAREMARATRPPPRRGRARRGMRPVRSRSSGFGMGKDDCACEGLSGRLQGGRKGANIDRSNRLVNTHDRHSRISSFRGQGQMGRASGRSRARPHRPHHPPRQDDRSRGPRDGSTRGRDRRGDRAPEGACGRKLGKAPLAEVLASRHEGHKY